MTSELGSREENWEISKSHNESTMEKEKKNKGKHDEIIKGGFKKLPRCICHLVSSPNSCLSNYK